jgi:hypothetical protein
LLRPSHFAVGLFLGCVVFRQRGSTGHCSVSSRILSSGFTSHQSITQQYLVSQPQPTNSSLGLLVPTAHQESKVHLPRVQPTRYVPPSGFDYPPGGLLPSIPCRFFFTPAALMGLTLRRFLLSQGIRNVSVPKDPLAVQPSGVPATEAPGRPDRPRFLGFDPSESSWRPDKGLACYPLDPPLGFALLGFSGESLGRVFAQPPLTRFAVPAKPTPPAPQSINQLPLGLVRAPYQSMDRTWRPF